MVNEKKNIKKRKVEEKKDLELFSKH